MKRHFISLISLFSFLSLMLTSYSGYNNTELIFNGERASLLENAQSPICKVSDSILANFKLNYPLLIALDNDTLQEHINNQIFDFLTNYCQGYVKSSEFFLNYKVTHLNSKLLSIVYSGEVFTPSKVISQCFALNFNLENGKLLSIYDFVTKEKMIEFLNGEKFTVVENSHNHTLQFPINESYPRSSVISGDIEHNYDFYFTPNPLILKLLTLLQGVEHIGTIIAGIFIISAPPVLAGIFSGFTVFDIIRYRRFYKCVLLIPIYWMCWAWLYLITPVHELPPIWFNIFSAIYNIFEAHVATYLVGMWIWANAAFYVCVGPWIALIWTIVRFIKRRKNMRG